MNPARHGLWSHPLPSQTKTERVDAPASPCRNLVDIHSLNWARQWNPDVQGWAHLELATVPDKNILAEKEVWLFWVRPNKEQTIESSSTWDSPGGGDAEGSFVYFIKTKQIQTYPGHLLTLPLFWGSLHIQMQRKCCSYQEGSLNQVDYTCDCSFSKCQKCISCFSTERAEQDREQCFPHYFSHSLN